MSFQVRPLPALGFLMPASPQAWWSAQREKVCIGEVPMPPRQDCPQ